MNELELVIRRCKFFNSSFVALVLKLELVRSQARLGCTGFAGTVELLFNFSAFCAQLCFPASPPFPPPS